MKLIEIESWVLRVVDQVRNNHPNEDARVELKTTWPDEIYKAARQIAAHANAARGENILWIIGLDEKKGVIGVDNKELSNWYSQVESYFDDIAPEVIDLNIHIGKQTLIALLFVTDRAPFVVKNPAYGTKDGGSVELEVPWREGRKTRSAHRGDLIRLLEPLLHQPSIEVLDIELIINSKKSENQVVGYDWYLRIEFYIAPLHGEQIIIPFHKCEVRLKIKTQELVSWQEIRLKPPTYYSFSDVISTRTDSLTIDYTGSEVIIAGPGRLILSANIDSSNASELKNYDALLSVKLQPIGTNWPISILQSLMPVKLENEDKERYFAKWIMRQNNDLTRHWS